MEEDRISGLPDSLIHHILSFLEMKDVMRTSTLSRSWRYLWTSVPVLDFGDWMTRSLDIASCSQCLMRYEGGKIRRFNVNLYYEVDECQIDSWIHFAVKHDVEELKIQFYDDRLYKFPPHLLECGALRVLKLGGCVVNISGSCCFRSLTKLHLDSVKVTDLDTSGCPLLEKISMVSCNGDINIYAPNKKLRYLKDRFYFDDIESSSLTLYAPHLLSIKLRFDRRNSYSCTSFLSIQSASLLFSSERLHWPESDDLRMMVELFKSLSRAKTLKLSPYCVEILYVGRKANNLKEPLFSATNLELQINLDNYQLFQISSLLRSFSCLETLVVEIEYKKFESDYFDGIKSWELLGHAISDLQLKTVIIHEFLVTEDLPLPEQIASPDMYKYLDSSGREMKLVKLLLKNCKVLDKMIIHTTGFLSPSLKSTVHLELAQNLLVLPRASANAKIHLESNSNRIQLQYQ